MCQTDWKYKRQAMTAAKQLGYGDAVILRVKASNSVIEIDRIMRTTRLNMPWRQEEKQMVKEPEVVTYYTLEEARKLIRREDVRKRNLLLRRLTQKGVGVAIIVATILTKEIAAIVFAMMLGLYLIFTKEKWMQGLFLLDKTHYMMYYVVTKEKVREI